MWPLRFFQMFLLDDRALLNVFWHELRYACLTYKKQHPNEQNVPLSPETPRCSGPQDTNCGFQVDTLDFLLSCLWVSFAGCWPFPFSTSLSSLLPLPHHLSEMFNLAAPKSMLAFDGRSLPQWWDIPWGNPFSFSLGREDHTFST